MKKLILILSEPRTGSNLLNEVLNLYTPIRTFNEFFLSLGPYIKDDFVPVDLPHKILFKQEERDRLFDSLNVQRDNYQELIKTIHSRPFEALSKFCEIIPNDNLVIKIHRQEVEDLQLYKLFHLPWIEIIILERSSRIHSFVSLLKARQLEQWHNVDTSNVKVHINPEEFTREQQVSIDWYKKLKEQLASKNYLEVNYERDLENLNLVNLYELFDPWFEKINIPVNKSNYKLKYFKKQDKTPIENSILNYSEVKDLII